jgi:hypothetical protein
MIIIPDIPFIPPQNTTDITSPIPLTKHTNRITDHVHFISFNNLHIADINISPRITIKYPKIYPCR